MQGESLPDPKVGSTFWLFHSQGNVTGRAAGIILIFQKLVLPPFLDMAWGGEHSLDAIYVLFRERTALTWSYITESLMLPNINKRPGF